MYGLVNKLVVATIERHYGADRWREASRALPFDSHRYMAMQPYDDDETYAIVATACGHLSVAAADLMRLIGRDWWPTHRAMSIVSCSRSMDRTFIPSSAI